MARFAAVAIALAVIGVGAGRGEAPPPNSDAAQITAAMQGQTGLVVASADDIARRIPRRLTLYRAAHNPRVLILDFPDAALQARTLNRIAVFAEMKGAPHDRVPDEAETRRLIAEAGRPFDHFYLGHDYDAATLARFFSLAGADGLSPEEARLRNILLHYHVLRTAADGFVATTPVQALISIADLGGTPGDAVALRRQVLRHELAHGEFFTRLFYRAACDRFWRQGLNGYERNLFLRFLDREGYDIRETELVINEVQAYLGFTAGPGLFDARQLGIDDIAFDELRQRFHRAMNATPAF
ncbi:hypothetical protein [Zavarzinia aquatilis]|uniref:Uncharacterized protein n=1 Tax=Zavarzinia aquatilis TaxID=2211142 RepID=A0A317EDF5_9PROT|nr:hypothetical protein [Zavarzinia aquatilis]PWR25058.1 hypothetical protein DKG74_04635 [Zavarzinia aquatilis]